MGFRRAIFAPVIGLCGEKTTYISQSMLVIIVFFISFFIFFYFFFFSVYFPFPLCTHSRQSTVNFHLPPSRHILPRPPTMAAALRPLDAARALALHLVAAVDQHQSSPQTTTLHQQQQQQQSTPLSSTLPAITDAIKSQAAKLALLATTPPFTPSAVRDTLAPISETLAPGLAAVAMVGASVVGVEADLDPNGERNREQGTKQQEENANGGQSTAATSEAGSGYGYTPAYTPAFFVSELREHVAVVLREWAALLAAIHAVAAAIAAAEGAAGARTGTGSGKTSAATNTPDAAGAAHHDHVTSTVGRLWTACDALAELAVLGPVKLVLRRAKAHLELVRDGVRELEEWDPADEEGEGDPFGLELDDEDGDKLDSGEKGKGGDDDDNDNDEVETARLLVAKTDTIRLLRTVAALFPAICTHRLTPASSSSSSSFFSAPTAARLDALAASLRTIPDLIDDVAGALYEHDEPQARLVRDTLVARARRVVDGVRVPFFDGVGPGAGADGDGGGSGGGNDGGSGEGSESGKGKEKFVRWADTWERVLGEIVAMRDA